MTRKYELKKRAEKQEETKQRIVEAAVELHRTKGPGLTTFSDIARLAGVQRHTLYRHFPDERSMLLACSGHYAQVEPPPDPGSWRAEADATRRLRLGLTEMYDFYERAEEMLTRVVRDAEFHEATREIQAMRGGKFRAAAHDVLSEALPRTARTRSMLNVALDFRTWKRLVRLDGLTRKAAVETMVKAVLAQ